jgi:hypothetical protein
MNRDDLKTLSKNEIPTVAQSLSKDDVAFLVQTLPEKEDIIRYYAFLLLQANSKQAPYTYEHWSTLESKLSSENSYQRSLGLMLLAENVRWDKEGKFDKTLPQYLKGCSDEKFITARQAIQGLAQILAATNKYDAPIKQHLSHMSILQYKDNQQKLLSKDIGNILKIIEKRKSK